MPAGMGSTVSANCCEAPISARTRKQAPALPRAIHACIFALATLQLLRHDMSYNVSNPVPRQHGARSTTIVNDAYYPGPGGKMHSWKRNLALELAQTKLPKKVYDHGCTAVFFLPPRSMLTGVGGVDMLQRKYAGKTRRRGALNHRGRRRAVYCAIICTPCRWDTQ